MYCTRVRTTCTGCVHSRAREIQDKKLDADKDTTYCSNSVYRGLLEKGVPNMMHYV